MCSALHSILCHALFYIPVLLQELIIDSPLPCSLCSKILCSITWRKQDTFAPETFKEAYLVNDTTFQKRKIENQHLKKAVKFRYHSYWKQLKPRGEWNGQSLALSLMPDDFSEFQNFLCHTRGICNMGTVMLATFFKMCKVHKSALRNQKCYTNTQR